ncbi:MAG: hypothetical protein LBD91_01635, partial [Prevotellaceae bacterium]|nr:hypothetical protein [Prevotellaceae bacterium]
MKRLILLSALTLSMTTICGQQSVVRVEQLGADYVATLPTVSFRVYWDTPPDNVRHLDSVWL